MKVILYTDLLTNKLHIVSVANGVDVDTAVKVSVPLGLHYEVVDASSIPKDRTFRDAWKHDTTKKSRNVYVDIKEAKEVAHQLRRASRDEKFAPLDKESMIPSLAKKAEAKRVLIRASDAAIQDAINLAKTEIQLKKALT